MTNKLQLVLINVLIWSILHIKVSQGSVATRLSCDGIFNDQFVTQLLLSLTVKEFWKSVNICRSYWQESSVLFLFTECQKRILLGMVFKVVFFCKLDRVARGRLKMQDWKMRYGQNCNGGKCRSKPYGTPTRDYIETALSYFVILVLILLTE